MTSPEIETGLAHWHEYVATGDMNKLDELTADNVVFRSPFLWKPKPGKAMLKIVLSAASHVFEDFAYHRQMTDGTSWTLEFSAHIGPIELKGVDIIRFNAEGKIEEFEVLIRPAKGLQALGEAMARKLAEQGTWEQFSQG
jgi:hypothetical protein